MTSNPSNHRTQCSRHRCQLQRLKQRDPIAPHALLVAGYEMQDKIKDSEPYQRSRDEVNQFDQRWGGFKQTFRYELKQGFKSLGEDLKKQAENEKKR